MSDLLETDVPFDKFISENFLVTHEKRIKHALETRLETLELVRQALGDESINFENQLNSVALQVAGSSALAFSSVKFSDYSLGSDSQYLKHEDLLEYKRKSPYYEKELREIRFFKKHRKQQEKKLAKSVKRCYNSKEKLIENNNPELFNGVLDV